MSKLQEYKKLQAELQKFASNNQDEIIQDALSAAFTVDKDIKAVLVVGFTPGFNDGEPCTHTQYSIIEGSELKEYVDEYEEFQALLLGVDSMDDENEDGSCNYDNFEELELPKVDYKKRAEATAHLDAVEDLLESTMGTDWIILAVRQEDGSIKVLSDDSYDCGY